MRVILCVVISITVILSGIAYVLSQNILNDGHAMSGPPRAKLLDPEVDPPTMRIELGTTVNIRITGKNEGGDAQEGYLSMSFPSDPRALAYLSNSTDLMDSKLHKVGSRLNAGYGLHPYGMQIYYPILEGWTEWLAGEEHYLEVELEPKHVGFFVVFAKLVLWDGSSSICCFYYDPDSSTTGLIDQQSEYVIPIYISVEPPTGLPIVPPEAELSVDLDESKYSSSMLPQYNVFKDEPYWFNITITNRDPVQTVTTGLLLYETTEDVGYYDPYMFTPPDLYPGEDVRQVFAYEPKPFDWKGPDPFTAISAALFAEDELECIQKGKAFPEWNKFAADVLGEYPKLAKVLKLAGEFINVGDFLFGFIELANLKSEKPYVYTYFDNTNSYEGILRGMPLSWIVHVQVPTWIWSIVIASIIIDIIASIATLWAVGIAATIVGGPAAALLALVEATASGISFFLDLILSHDPPRDDYLIDPDVMVYRPIFPPDLEAPDTPLAHALNESLIPSSEILARVGAMWEAYEKFLGALRDSSVEGMRKQLSWMSRFSTEIDLLVENLDEKFEEVVDIMHSDSLVLTKPMFDSSKTELRSGLREEEMFVLNQYSKYGLDPSLYHDMVLDMDYSWAWDYDILRYADLISPLKFADFRGTDEGGLPPDLEEADFSDCGPYYGYEGLPVSFSATCADVGNGTIVGTQWDFDGDGSADRHEVETSYIWYDNVDQMIGLSIDVLHEYTYTDATGNTTTVRFITTQVVSLEVKIRNRDPEIHDVSPDSPSRIAGYLLMNLTLRAAGEKFHDVTLDLWNVTDNTSVKTLTVYREPGDPDEQSATKTQIYIDIEKAYIINVTYNPYDDPINGRIFGATPTWVFFTFKDGIEVLHHCFNVRRSNIGDSEHWNHIEPWLADLSPVFTGHEWTFVQKTTDPGTDDLRLVWDWGDGNLTQADYSWDDPKHIFHDDGGPTPYDLDEREEYPMTVVDDFYYTYWIEGNYDVNLTVKDDEVNPWRTGFDWDTLQVRAIHLPHIAPVK